MSPSRRDCVKLVAGGLAAGALPVGSSASGAGPVKAVAFDAFAVLDPRPVFALAESLFPGRGTALSDAWRTRQFEYQWLRALGGRYANFLQATEEALVFATASLKLDLTPERRRRLVGAYLELKAWPEAGRALESLKGAGLRLAFLSNATPEILAAGIANSGLRGIFEHVLSTDAVKTYKPAPGAYQMAVDAFALRREEILFVAFAGWDAAGAKWFGYPTFWANRLGASAEELGVRPDGVGRDLTDVAAFVGASR